MAHHNSRVYSHRVEKPVVPVNCGPIPESLLQGGPFGDEPGAFTGVARSCIGRFELADSGTLFIDEVGDLSPAPWVKLLRALQERSFEHVGNSKNVRIDLLIIAATNRYLEEETHAVNFARIYTTQVD
jgi:transcriptional regulator with GAF, ATPase, and Fis domain